VRGVDRIHDYIEELVVELTHLISIRKSGRRCVGEEAVYKAD
jgi:hypothetical protein